MPEAETFKYREAFEGFQGVLPGETAPRLLIYHTFPAGPDGLTSPRAGAGLGMNDILRYFSNGEPDYGTDFAEVYSRQTHGANTPGAIDVYRLVPSDASKASAVLNDQASGTPVVIGEFEAVGSGAAYNKRIYLTCVEVIESTGAFAHPAGAKVPVFDVEIEGPNPRYPAEVFRRVVFTHSGETGSSAYHKTIDAAGLTDRSMVINFTYDPDADTADLAASADEGDVITLNLVGGTDGSATLDANDYKDAFDDTVNIPFRWRVVPNPPEDTVIENLHMSNKAAPFGLAILVSPYAFSTQDALDVRDTIGKEADDGKSAFVWGWGAHPAILGREAPYAAAYFGRFSAKINATGLGGEYPVGNQGLGFTTIAEAHKLTGAQEQALSKASIMFARQMYDASYGVHGSWTLDAQLDRMGDLGVRVMWNDIIRRLALQFTPLAHNRGATVLTRNTIQRFGDMAIRKYLDRGYVKKAATGISSIEEAAARFPGLSFPDLPGWVVYLAQIIFYPTLQGVFAHLTDADVAGLTEIGASGGEGE